MRGREALFFVGASVALAELSVFAFSNKTRRVIKKRSGGVSEISGENGVPLECSHLNHNRSYKYYDHPDNGVYVTIYEHLAMHLEAENTEPDYYSGKLKNGLTPEQNLWAIEKITERIKDYEGTVLQPTASIGK